jgi:large subunit ribosomal protein L6
MSRIGKQPVPVPQGVKVDIQKDNVRIESGQSKIITRLPDGIRCEHKDGQIVVHRRDGSRTQKAFHGMIRSHLSNAVHGVLKGFQKELDIIGIGYRAQVKGRTVVFNIGYSHPIEYPLPEGLEVKIDKNTHLTLTGCDKQLVGQVAAEMRALRPPEPYKGKGIRFSGEHVRRKAGKAGKTGQTA